MASLRQVASEIDRQFGVALRNNFILQCLVIVLASMLLFPAATLLATNMAWLTLPYWCGTLLILLRRHAHPTRWDVAFVQWGYLWVVALAFGIFILRSYLGGGEP